MPDIKTRILNVFIGKERIGYLSDIDGYWAFEYSKDWLQYDDSFAICPNLPLVEGQQLDGGTFRPVQRFFDNLLPEENARLLLARELKVDHEDSFALLAASGVESAGALTLLKQDMSFPATNIVRLHNKELNHRIEKLPVAPLNRREGSRMSLAGAQHKMLIVMLDGDIYEGNAGTPSTHILKPEHSEPERYWQTVRNEWFIMKLASRLGLNTPNVLIRHLPKPVYIIERFDREGFYPDAIRKHIIDACQLLGFGRGSKYSASTPDTYRKLLDKARSKAATSLRLYQWVVFNLLIGNGDAHLKNLSFFYSKGAVELTPFYDLLCTTIYVRVGENPLDEKLSVPINGKERFGEITRDDVLQFASEIGVPLTPAKKIIDVMILDIESNFEKLYKEVETSKLTPSKAGDIRMLREIKYKVLKPMLGQLTA